MQPNQAPPCLTIGSVFFNFKCVPGLRLTFFPCNLLSLMKISLLKCKLEAHFSVILAYVELFLELHLNLGF